MIKIILLILAVLCFIFAAFNVAIGSLNLVPLGLAFGFSAMLPWKS